MISRHGTKRANSPIDARHASIHSVQNVEISMKDLGQCHRILSDGCVRNARSEHTSYWVERRRKNIGNALQEGVCM